MRHESATLNLPMRALAVITRQEGLLDSRQPEAYILKHCIVGGDMSSIAQNAQGLLPQDSDGLPFEKKTVLSIHIQR